MGGYCEYVNKTVELQDWQEVVHSDEGLLDSQDGNGSMQVG